MKKLIAKIKLFRLVLKMKHYFIISVKEEALYELYYRKPFDINYMYEGIHRVHMDQIIEELYFSKDNIDRVLERAIYEAELSLLN